jgi:hypothetical protein
MRRINSSVLPENIEPVMTVSDPVLEAEASTGGSKICVMVHILPTTWLTTCSTPLAQVAPALAAFSSVPDDGDHYRPQDHQARGRQEKGDVLGRLASQVRV